MQCVEQHGGVMTLEDLKSHESTFDAPIKTTYRGVDVWEMPPNGQGITALLALNILEGFDFKGKISIIISVASNIFIKDMHFGMSDAYADKVTTWGNTVLCVYCQLSMWSQSCDYIVEFVGDSSTVRNLSQYNDTYTSCLVAKSRLMQSTSPPLKLC